MTLPALLYEDPQKCCTQCRDGAHASRHLEKVPLAQRRNKKPKAQDMAADAAMKAVGKGFKAIKGLGLGGKKK
eukprot:SAG31_NODE_4583_length_3118_cov_2.039086_5_plen_73_part_00